MSILSKNTPIEYYNSNTLSVHVAAYEDELPPTRKRHKQGFFHTNALVQEPVVCVVDYSDYMQYMSIMCCFSSPTAPPEATSEIVQESSHTNSASGTTQQEQQTTEGEL